jgi:hypothetical protein
MHDYDDVAMSRRSPNKLKHPYTLLDIATSQIKPPMTPRSAPRYREETAVIIFCGAITNILMLRSLAEDEIKTMSPLDRTPILVLSILYSYISNVWPVVRSLNWCWLSTLLVLSVIYVLIIFTEYRRRRRQGKTTSV